MLCKRYEQEVVWWLSVLSDDVNYYGHIPLSNYDKSNQIKQLIYVKLQIMQAFYDETMNY